MTEDRKQKMVAALERYYGANVYPNAGRAKAMAAADVLELCLEEIVDQLGWVERAVRDVAQEVRQS
jgi:hypothetical protein